MPDADYQQLQLAGRQNAEQYLVTQVAGQLQRLYRKVLGVE
jgi:hypothetical protein